MCEKKTFIKGIFMFVLLQIWSQLIDTYCYPDDCKEIHVREIHGREASFVASTAAHITTTLPLAAHCIASLSQWSSLVERSLCINSTTLFCTVSCRLTHWQSQSCCKGFNASIRPPPGDEHRVTSWIASAIVDVEVTQEGDWWLIFGLRLIAVII